MKKMPGVLLFVILVLVILQILTLRTLSSAEKRIEVLEKQVSTLIAAPKAAAQPAPTASVPADTPKRD